MCVFDYYCDVCLHGNKGKQVVEAAGTHTGGARIASFCVVAVSVFTEQKAK